MQGLKSLAVGDKVYKVEFENEPASIKFFVPAEYYAYTVMKWRLEKEEKFETVKEQELYWRAFVEGLKTATEKVWIKEVKEY